MPPFFQTYVGLKFLLQAEPALKCNFGSKLVEVRRGEPSQSCDVRRFPSPITSPFLGHALTFEEVIFAFSLYEMSLDISNPR